MLQAGDGLDDVGSVLDGVGPEAPVADDAAGGGDDVGVRCVVLVDPEGPQVTAEGELAASQRCRAQAGELLLRRPPDDAAGDALDPAAFLVGTDEQRDVAVGLRRGLQSCG